jgi:hypothetical protein
MTGIEVFEPLKKGEKKRDEMSLLVMRMDRNVFISLHFIFFLKGLLIALLKIEKKNG